MLNERKNYWDVENLAENNYLRQQADISLASVP